MPRARKRSTRARPKIVRKLPPQPMTDSDFEKIQTKAFAEMGLVEAPAIFSPADVRQALDEAGVKGHLSKLRLKRLARVLEDVSQACAAVHWHFGQCRFLHEL